ncbi:MAG: HlyD family efflux transporter periplasmic adaptor subunit [Phycisphaerae bacterium]|nr:HlyD family efflux transporter periplasmic adaptor subunit [Phycisphaerae bacterium]
MNDTASNNEKTKPRPPRTKRSRWTPRRVMLVLLVLLAGCAAAAWMVPTTRWVRAEGYVITDEEAEIRPSVEGAIESWSVKNGDQVRQGDVLVRLKCEVHKAALDRAVSERNVAEAKLANLKKEQEMDELKRKEAIFRAEQILKGDQETLDRMEASQTGAVSRLELSNARLKVEVAKSNLAELRLDPSDAMAKEVQVLRKQIEAARKAEKLQAAEIELRTIRAAVNGEVQLHRFEVGEVVKPDHVLGQVFDTSRWIVKLTLPERALAYVRENQPVRVELSAYPAWRYGYLQARVQEVQRVVTARATGDGVFYVEAVLDDPGDKKLTPGMRVSAEVNAGETNWILRLFGW